MSLLGDMIVAGIKGIKFNPQFYEDKKYKVWICICYLRPLFYI